MAAWILMGDWCSEVRLPNLKETAALAGVVVTVREKTARKKSHSCRGVVFAA
jgi:hypothetical protein